MSKDAVANAYKIVRDATTNQPGLSLSDKLGVLELVKHELLANSLHQLQASVMNTPVKGK